MRLASIVGARPQFVKLAPVSRAIAAASLESFVIHTGQHYDAGMSDVFFDELQIPQPNVQLAVGSGPHGKQTGLMLERLEAALLEHEPDVVLTYGDTNSTLAATLAAAKLHIAVVHVESGLRSFNRRMPEECNRIVADHLADILFAPTDAAMRNLAAEGLSARAEQVGDVMLDAVQFNRSRAASRSRVLETLGLTPGNYRVATVHRAETTDSGDALLNVLNALNLVAREDRPIVFPVHPRTAARIRTTQSGWRAAPGLRLIEPLGYLDTLRLLESAQLVLTDSGGVQKEAFFLGRPCITLRDETEWVETVEEGANVLTGTAPEAIVSAVASWDRRLAQGSFDVSAALARTFGDGNAAGRIVARTVELMNLRRRK